MWAVVNVIQLTSHLVLIDAQIPSNLGMYFSLLSFTNQFLAAFPGVPNIFSYVLRVDELPSRPFAPQYSNLGYETRSILLLCGGELQSLALILVLIPLVQALSGKVPLLSRLDNKLRYGAAIRPIIEGYFKFSLCAFISFGAVRRG